MIYIKGINELFGINRGLRTFRYMDEHEAFEIEIYVKRKTIYDISTNIRKEKETNIKSITFKIPSFNRDTIRIDFLSWFPIKSPGTTDYIIYMNDKPIDCSRTIAKSIYELILKIYKPFTN